MSDPYQIPVCDRCGRIIAKECVCGSKTSDVQIPYAAKLLFQELQALGLSIRIKGEEC
jgi:DNA-directed RNA polymerase beta subunit